MKLPLVFMTILATALMLNGCQRQKTEQSAEHAAPETNEPAVAEAESNEPAMAESSAAQHASVMPVTIEGLTFDAPETVPSGWTTIRLTNNSGMVHFAVVERLPEGITIKEQQKQAAPPFQQGMDLLNKGEDEAAQKKFGELPDWFQQMVYTGGPGLTSGGHHSQTTLYLEPGNYLLECYVKTDGVFHSYNPDPNSYGMVHAFTVTDDASGADEPAASIELTISSDNGIDAPEQVAAGEQTVAVHFADQTLHENFAGHDVHLARLDENTDLQVLDNWMDWRRPEGLQTPAPVTFLGGSNEMPAGKTAYFTVTLKPGRYAWISEVPGPHEKGMLKTFEVTDSNSE